MRARACTGIGELCAALADVPRVVLLTEEALAGDALDRLAVALAAVPGVEVPVLVLAAARRQPPARELVRRYSEVFPGVVVIMRPVHPAALLSAVRTATRTLARECARLAETSSRAAEAPAACATGAEREPTHWLIEAVRKLPIMLFEQDAELRYTAVQNAPGNRPPESLLRRRDVDWIPDRREAEALEAFKRRALEAAAGARERFRLTLDGATHEFDVIVAPRPGDDGSASGLVGAALRIDDYVAVQEQLRRQVEQLARMDQRKNDFLAQLAHELRNPLAPIYNALHVLKIQPQPPDPVHLKWAVDVIGRQLQQLTRLVEDLLDIARISRGGLRLKAETIELGRTLMQAIEATRPLTTARRQTLTYSPPLEPLHVRADPARLLQIVGNLLNNAARYTPSGGHIALSVRREDEHAVITVVDDGVGIAGEVLAHIFEPFYQGNRDTVEAQAGLGLGLTLVRRLVEMHDGSVEAESAGVGKGSCFTVRLPLVREPAPGVIPAADTRGRSGLRVLVVDDDVDVAQSFALLLHMMGHAAEAASSAAEALARAARFQPHVAFVDIALPEMDGYALAQKLRGACRERLFLVAMTGHGNDDVRRRATAAGFDTHVTKPTTAEAIEALLAPLQPSAPSRDGPA